MPFLRLASVLSTSPLECFLYLTLVLALSSHQTGFPELPVVSLVIEFVSLSLCLTFVLLQRCQPGFQQAIQHATERHFKACCFLWMFIFSPGFKESVKTG